MKFGFLIGAAFVAGGAAAQTVVTGDDLMAPSRSARFAWYAADGRPAAGMRFDAALSRCLDSPEFVSNAAEECMRRRGYAYEPEHAPATAPRRAVRKAARKAAVGQQPARPPLYFTGAPIRCGGFVPMSEEQRPGDCGFADK